MWKNLREQYESTEIPGELAGRVETAIKKGRRRRRMRRSRWLTSTLAACAVLVLLVNVSPVFASAVYDIPVLGQLCRLVTFQDYQEESDTYIADVRIPHVDTSALTGDTAWADAVNETITNTIQAEVDASMQRAQEYYDAYVETGGDPASFIPVSIHVDYEVKHADEEILSFVIHKTETLASAYQRNYYYNIDLATGEELTLEMLLGSGWEENAAEQVERQLQELPEDQQGMLFLEYIDLVDVVSSDAGFYFDEAGTVVLVFPEYSLGAGALGILEFPLDK